MMRMPRLGAFLANIGDRCLWLAELVDPLDLPPLDSADFMRRALPPPPAPTVYLNAGAFSSYSWRDHV